MSPIITDKEHHTAMLSLSLGTIHHNGWHGLETAKELDAMVKVETI
jgi:hypothetical protein